MLLPGSRNWRSYGWIEQTLYVSDAAVPAHDPAGDLLDGVPVLSPLAVRWRIAGP